MPGREREDALERDRQYTRFLLIIWLQEFAENGYCAVHHDELIQGQMPLMRENGSNDFYVIPADNPEEIQAKPLRMVTERIPQGFGLHPMRDVQVLTPAEFSLQNTKIVV